MKKDKKIKRNSRKNVRMLVFFISISIFIIFSFILYESLEEDNDLSIIGQGENVVVQVHDPG